MTQSMFTQDESNSEKEPASAPESQNDPNSNAVLSEGKYYIFNFYFVAIPLPDIIPREGILPEIFVGVLLALIGVIFLIFGYRYLKKILFIIGASAGSMTAYTILLNIEKSTNGGGPLFGDARALIFTGICLGCALILGVITLALWRVGLVIAGGLGGLSLGVFLLSLPPISSAFESDGEDSIIRPILLALMVGTGGLATLFFESIVIMASTAMFGAGCICVCIDIYARTGFCDAIRSILQNRGSIEMNSSFAGLLVSYGVLSLIGFYLQYRSHRFDRHRHLLVADETVPVYKV